jgi:hypothetical protein
MQIIGYNNNGSRLERRRNRGMFGDYFSNQTFSRRRGDYKLLHGYFPLFILES